MGAHLSRVACRQGKIAPHWFLRGYPTAGWARARRSRTSCRCPAQRLHLQILSRGQSLRALRGLPALSSGVYSVVLHETVQITRKQVPNTRQQDQEGHEMRGQGQHKRIQHSNPESEFWAAPSPPQQNTVGVKGSSSSASRLVGARQCAAIAYRPAQRTLPACHTGSSKCTGRQTRR